MKKAISLLVVNMMLLSLCACGSTVAIGDKAAKTSIEVGDTYTFGHYEQDNDMSNGKENIEWLVLAKKSNKILVISKHALDCQKYNAVNTDVTWETCSLRKWLNNTFLNEAFSTKEQVQIQNTAVSADKNPEFSTNPGNSTKDKVFVLSITEAAKYFTTDESRKCVPTVHAMARGAWAVEVDRTVSGASTCWWWLRSSGYEQDTAASVGHVGSVSCGGSYVDRDDGCVRPALWINLDSSSADKEDFSVDSEESYDKVSETSIEVGDYITFGTYEQDNDTSNGKEDIEWLVLAKENGRALVISSYALDYQEYNAVDTDVTWETCSLREWLNGTFFNDAFSINEQKKIKSTSVPADRNPMWDKMEDWQPIPNAGKSTTDKVFLLSVVEAKKYFPSRELLHCEPTAYAIAQGADPQQVGTASCEWWLRTTGYSQDTAVFVENNGSIDTLGYPVNFNRCISPALWINLDTRR